ncbi:formylglycine-generating enzyme family protein [Bythopirellula goksoeyrii]|uniref:Formylglycine-generating sulfatase enzyme n=1 Tax=Bythopirellula goksoeyrii TaxID=1400387 RepID=A0A5B9QBE9_9BACT|nr:SUMF1/EgtB/PvdO family nonheme iron enzyme [Bythopirellula goksoeyrii]QEG34895.1 Formylglycine-generating sulfatase enzyme [Bythopirellula goksoeyrii]
MKHSNFWSVVLFYFCAFALSSLPAAVADTFGSGANSFEIEFVTVGDPGNVADTTGDPNPAGAVSYTYRIGKFEIPEEAIRKANTLSADAGDPLGITLDSRGLQKPATSVSWFEAARFVNWLNTSTGNTPAYKFDTNGDFQLWNSGDAGYDPTNLFRNRQAKYFLPSADEWYKAAFYDPVSDQWFDFPNGSDTAPNPVSSGIDPNTAVYNQSGPADVMLAGGPSPFGIVGLAGNVFEWEESNFDLQSNNPLGIRGVRGSDWSVTTTFLDLSSSFRNHSLPNNEPTNVGFRVAQIPEPRTATLCFLIVLCMGIKLDACDRLYL